MTIDRAGSIANDLQRVEDHAAESEMRAKRLDGLTARLFGDGSQAAALVETFQIFQDLMAQQH